MSQMQVGGGGHRSSQNVPNGLGGGGGVRKLWDNVPKFTSFFFEGIPNIKNPLILISMGIVAEVGPAEPQLVVCFLTTYFLALEWPL